MTLSTEDQRVIEGLYEKYSHAIYLSAYKAFRGDPHTANDVVADTFKSVVRQYEGSFKGKSDRRVEATIRTIAHHRIVDEFRRVGRVVLLGDSQDVLVQDSITPLRYGIDPCGTVLDRDELERLWDIMVTELTQTEYRVAYLAWEVGLNVEEIATVLAIPTVGTVRTHKSRAKTKITVLLGGRVSFDSDDVSTINPTTEKEGTA